MKQTPHEETVRQLKILNGTLNPMGAFVRVAIWITVIVVAFGLLLKLGSLISR